MEKLNIYEDILNAISEYNESEYSLNSSIQDAKIFLEEEMVRNPLSNCLYDHNQWYIQNTLEEIVYKIDFTDLVETIQFNKNFKPNFINILKCWTASLIDSYSAPVIKSMVMEGLRDFFIVTKGLTLSNYEDISDDISSMGTIRKHKMCLSAMNFFDYYSEVEEQIILLLHQIKKNFKVISKARLIPPTRDILVFSKVLEKFFSNSLSDSEYFKWFPVWLWWNLTTIIPLRPSEFCHIERNCLFQRDGLFYIKLPRKKLKKVKGRQVQRVSEVYVPESLYREIEEYKRKTVVFGTSDTLISYRSIPESWSNTFYPNRHQHKKNNPDKFTLPIFREILKSYYEQVVFNSKYEWNNQSVFSTTNLQKLKPGDTRHLAFINLKRMGYHPVEIARLGGHTHLQSQEFYFNHLSNFVDLEILELLTNTDISKGMDDNSIGTSFVERYILRPAKTTTKIKMKDGYCTDINQNCKVEDCWECDSWRISEEEFMNKKEILEEKMNSNQSYLNDAIENLKSLYQSIYSNLGKDDYYSEDNPEVKKQLVTYSKRIDNAVRKHVNILKVRERIDSVGNKR